MLTGGDIIDIFDVYMAAGFHHDDYPLMNPTAKSRDYIDLLAAMDIVAGNPAFPGPIIINDYESHSPGVEILECAGSVHPNGPKTKTCT